MKTILAVVVLLVCVQVSSAALYQVTDLGPASGDIAMNNNGWVTWYGGSSYGSLLYKNGETTNVNVGVAPGPSGISDTGIIVGSNGFMWQNNQTTALPFSPTSVNNGTVVGNGQYDDGSTVLFGGLCYQNGVITNLRDTYRPAFRWSSAWANAINNNGTIVGAVGIGNHNQYGLNPSAVAWFGLTSAPTDLGAGIGSQAIAVSSDDRIIGNDGNPNNCWLWQNGSLQWLGQTPAGRNFQAISVNADGQVLGKSWDLNGNVILELWQDNVFTDLGVLPVGTNGCFNYSEAVINDSGQIAAICRIGSVPNSGPYEAVLISEVPEPATLGLLGLGLIALLRRRRT